LCDQRFSATQYALLSSLLAVGRDVLVAPAGFPRPDDRMAAFLLDQRCGRDSGNGVASLVRAMEE